MTNYLQPHQARTVEPTPYEKKLAGAIEEVFGTGRHDLPGLVDGLNQMGVPAPHGDVWTAESFTTEMKRLAAPQRPAGKEA
jgi:hypothetical protein